MLLANQTGDRVAPFTHEGYWQLIPNLSVSQQTDNSNFACNGIVPGYSLFPLVTENGTPVYRKDPSYEWEGNAAGDALYHTDQTMQGLSMLGRNGWNGYWGDANIVIQTTALPADHPGFMREPPPSDNRFPPTSCVIIAPAFYMYNLAAALDIIAHEWGHGVIFTSSANFNDMRVGLELDEGFSDIIGQAVEKLRQPSGFGLELSSDWHFGEDAAGDPGMPGQINFTYARSGSQDDNTGHFWVGPNGFDPQGYNDRLHAGDTSFGSSVHETGNMLNVVFYLLTEGGYNPICGRLGHLEGCSTGAIALGVTKASKILFDTVQFYAQPNARWEDLATYATYAAFDLYSDCGAGNDAFVEQTAVNLAFKAIGYPRETPREQCP